MTYAINRYAAHGMARPVGPGIDVSHYGAPYQGMLGLGCVGCAGLGWVPGPGQTPRDDPRYLKQYSKVVLNYAVTQVPSGSAGPNALEAKARGLFPGQTVRKAWGNGWGSGVNSGRIGVEITLAAPMRLGEVKGKSKDMEGALSGTGLTGARISAAKTAYNAGDVMTDAEAAAHTGGIATPPSTGVPPPVTDPGEGDTNFLTQTAAGLPVWGWGLLGLGTLGAIGLAVTMTGRKRPAAVTANRRKRRVSKNLSNKRIYWGRVPKSADVDQNSPWYAASPQGAIRQYRKKEWAQKAARALAKKHNMLSSRDDRMNWLR